jgi:drug/metabolite transporter (DMT)-like permease
MRVLPLVGLVVTAVCISIGQLLFKITAERANVAQSLFAANVLIILCAAVALYGGATLVWVASLRYVPLTVAYLFMALSFVIVPVLAAVFLHEPLTLRFCAGMLLIIVGILVSLGAKLA